MTYEQIPVNRGSPRTGRTVLVVVAALLALCCVGGVVGGSFAWRSVTEARGPAQETVATFAGALVARDFPAAYGRLCRSERERISPERFSQMQSVQPALRSYDIVEVTVENRNGQLSGRAVLHLVAETGAETNQVFNLFKEDGDWRICS